MVSHNYQNLANCCLIFLVFGSVLELSIQHGLTYILKILLCFANYYKSYT